MKGNIATAGWARCFVLNFVFIVYFFNFHKKKKTFFDFCLLIAIVIDIFLFLLVCSF